MVTYSELIEFSMFIVTLIGLCYAIFKGRKQPPTTRNSDGCAKNVVLLRVGRFSGFSSIQGQHINQRKARKVQLYKLLQQGDGFTKLFNRLMIVYPVSRII